MNNIKIALMIASFISATTTPLIATANDFYGSVDAVLQNTEIGNITLGIGTGANFDTTHLRIRGGYHLLDYLALEAYVMTPDDATTDTTASSGGTTITVTDKIEIDPVIGVNLKLVKSFTSVDVYGLIGISRMDFDFEYAPLSNPGTTIMYSDSVNMYGAGVGLAFNIGEKMKLNFEGTYQVGTVDFNPGSTTSESADIDTIGFSAGVSYYF